LPVEAWDVAYVARWQWVDSPRAGGDHSAVNRTAEAVLLLAALSAAPLGAQESRPPERTVTGVAFEGNHALDDYTLAAAIATSNSSWTYRVPVLRSLGLGTRRLFDELEFRRDAIRLLLFYRQHGYYDARVDTTVRRSGNHVAVTFRIEEGPPVLVDSLDVQGAETIAAAPVLLRTIPLKQGKPFDRYLFDASSDSLVAALRNRGYPFATVYRSYSVDRRSRLAGVEFDVQPGRHARVGAIVVEGNQRVSAGTVVRRLTFRQGSSFSQGDLFESQRQLYQTDLFRYVTVAVAPESLVGGVDSLVRVRVQVAEATPLQLRFGAGYGTIDCFRTSGNVTVRNFLGESRQLDLAGRLAKIGVGAPLDFGFQNSVCPELANDPFSRELNYSASVTLTQPSFLSRRTTVSLSTFADKRSEFNAYLARSVGAALSLRYTVRSDLPVTLSFRISQDQTDAAPATYCVFFDQCDPALIAPFSAPLRGAALTLAAVNTTADSPVEPTRGRILTFEAAFAERWLGSQVVFDRFVGEAVRYVPLARRTVLALRLRAGIIRADLSTIGGQVRRYVPPPERFYAGGPTTLRGFGRNEMGPVVYVADSVKSDGTYASVRSSPVGSNGILLGNVELRFPTPLWGGRLALAAYVDGGEVWTQAGTTYLPGGLHFTPGLGLQVSTPLGPMRVDAAYNGYGTQPGPLYVITGSDRQDLTLQDPAYPGRPPGARFLSRIQWTFSVGLSF
jgi:outer membrane protein assembly complex protein YaeT